jgi:hypothetical protein
MPAVDVAESKLGSDMVRLAVSVEKHAECFVDATPDVAVRHLISLRKADILHWNRHP